MAMRILKKSLPHLFLWLLMVSYFVYAPDLVARVFIKAGKPLPPESSTRIETDMVVFAPEEVEMYLEKGQPVQGLNGWAYIVPQPGTPVDGFVKELSLISKERTYIFPVESKYHFFDPHQPGADTIDVNTLGFTALIAEDTIAPGKYRIGMIFRNPATGISYYWDKPAHYLIKTPNTLTLK
jgi:hypothetical protein